MLLGPLVIARSNSDEAIQILAQANWIASLTLAMTRKRTGLSIVTTGLDPVVHADVQRIKRRGESRQANAPHGLPDQVRQ